MKTFKQYSNMALFSALFMMTFIMGGCGGSSSCEDIDRPTIAVDDTTPPYILSTVPANNATNVLLNQTITATPSEALNPATVNIDTFVLTLDGDIVEIDGNVTYANNVMLFDPTADLLPGTEYTATVTTGIQDLAGNNMLEDHIWNFTTGTEIDDTPPTVILTVPEDNATNVPVTQTISATPSEPLDPLTVIASTFTLTEANNTTVVIEGNVTYDNVNNIMYFNPTDPLISDTNYTAIVTTGIQDLAGNNMLEDHVWNFTTEAADMPPYVISTVPEADETGVGLNTTITATLNKPLDPTTVDESTFTLTEANNTTVLIEGNVTYDNVNSQMHFNPTDPLAPDTEYTATVTTGIQDLNASNMLEDYVWNFTTVAPAPAQGPLPVDLGTAGDFTILAKTAITTTGTTAIAGNIGLSPAFLSDMTGFSPTLNGTYATSDLVTGVIYTADMDVPTPNYVGTAVTHMEAAYTDAAGRTTPAPTILVTNNLSGLTLAAGIYKTPTDIIIDSDATVTLSGGANDVWIFQIGQGLTLNDSAAVVLSGGAQAKNVFWQVGSNATIGTYANFKGVILSMTEIAVLTGATVEGRLLSQTAVTLQSNQVAP